jgi:uncharacterized protein YegP (UPF0339 family)
MKTSRYKVVETDDNQFQYQLYAKNNKVILTSVKHKSIDDVLDAICKTIKYGIDMNNFDMLHNNDFKLYFNVTENNDKVIAVSNTYSSERGLLVGCNSVMDNCEIATISYILGNKNG